MRSQALVRSALVLIANHYPQEDLSAGWISKQLGINPDDLNSAFLELRSHTCDLSILSYRLSRLFERITTDPETSLLTQVQGCGFASIETADDHFQTSFGIALTTFHAVSLRAAADRLHRRNHPHHRDLIINE